MQCPIEVGQHCFDHDTNQKSFGGRGYIVQYWPMFFDHEMNQKFGGGGNVIAQYCADLKSNFQFSGGGGGTLPAGNLSPTSSWFCYLPPDVSGCGKGYIALLLPGTLPVRLTPSAICIQPDPCRVGVHCLALVCTDCISTAVAETAVPKRGNISYGPEFRKAFKGKVGAQFCVCWE